MFFEQNKKILELIDQCTLSVSKLIARVQARLIFPIINCLLC